MFCGTKKEFVEYLSKYTDSDIITAPVWIPEDVKLIAPTLTDEQCVDVLRHVARKHDASTGISWDVLENAVDYLFDGAA